MSTFFSDEKFSPKLRTPASTLKRIDSLKQNNDTTINKEKNIKVSLQYKKPTNYPVPRPLTQSFSVPIPPPIPFSPPPPPPLPSLRSKISSVLSNNKNSKSRKLISWKKCRRDSINDSIWETISVDIDEEHMNINHEKLQEMFQKQKANISSSKSTENTCTKRLESEISFLNPKISLITNIFLKKFKLPPEKVADLIQSCNGQVFGVELLKSLKKMLPSEKEVIFIIKSLYILILIFIYLVYK